MQTKEYEENDFEELLYYIIDLLSEIGANQIIDQIKGLESLSVIEEQLVKDKQYTQQMDGQLMFAYAEEKAGEKSKYKDSDVGHYVTRQMTFKEMFLETLKILDTYLVSVPAMVNRTKDLLEHTPSELIQWRIEGKKRIDKETKLDSLFSVEALNGQTQEMVGKLLNDIYKEIGMGQKDAKKG